MFLENTWVMLAFLILGLYGLVLVRFVLAFIKKDKGQSQVISSLSIVLPIRNEAESISEFFTKLSACQLDGMEIEIVIVNDHSTDASLARIKEIQLPINIRVVDAPEGVVGKKLSSKLGVESAGHPWVLTVDIDAQLPNSFFKDIANSVSQSVQYAVVPLKPKRHNSLVRYFFDLEFISLHFVGMASAKMGKPLLSNAVCSLFRKEAFLDTVNDRGDWEIPSGDDVFAMFAIAHKYSDASVGVASIGSEKVEVGFPNSASVLWRQRLRWVGKSGQIKNTWFGFVSVLVLVFNLVVSLSIFLIIFHSFSTFGFVFLLGAAGIQFSFLMYVCNAVDRRDLIKWIVPLTLVYPFYLIALVIAQFFWKPKWK